MQTSIESELSLQVRSHTPLSIDSPMEFEAYFGRKEYLNFYELYLQLRGSFVLKHSGNPELEIKLDDWDNITPANYLLNTMFKTVSLQSGTKKLFTHLTTTTYVRFLRRCWHTHP